MSGSRKRVFDLVDDNDVIVGVGTKKDAKRRGLWTRSVHIFIFNSKGELLVCKRPGGKSYPNQLTSSAGGHVERGETYKIAAQRELKEELHVTVPIGDVGRFDVRNSVERAIHRLFVGRAKNTFLDSEEGVCGWTALNALRQDTMRHPRRYAKPFLEALRLYLRR